MGRRLKRNKYTEGKYWTNRRRAVTGCREPGRTGGCDFRFNQYESKLLKFLGNFRGWIGWVVAVDGGARPAPKAPSERKRSSFIPIDERYRPQPRPSEYRQTKNVNLFNGKGAWRHESTGALRDELENEEEQRGELQMKALPEEGLSGRVER